MVGGLVLLCLVPGLGLVGAGATTATVLGNAALGAGFSAYFTDYDSDDPGSWWLQVGLGAAFGVAGGYLGPVLGKVTGRAVGIAAKRLIPATITLRALQVGGDKISKVGKFAGKIGTKTTGETLVGGALGGAQQLTTNFINDREQLGDWDYWKSGSWLNGVGNSALLGLYGGAGLSIAVRGMRLDRAAKRLANSVRLYSLANSSRSRAASRITLFPLDESML
ncbi:hypothetical protein AMATHDRAFT_48085 [Amanita thiersii Skay4041]|uniref:Uncharacterized protein n=1 Tax=Amanita thiersii Skay4041 TaxID=703135 RepID=A0A2A9NGP5_9AGAR|nr:hypothetical protein AMATHDRAFT_48085 [Amanita thiersii Skay4041]